MSNFTCPTCGLTNIDCGKAGYKTAREIELEKQLEIAVNRFLVIKNQIELWKTGYYGKKENCVEYYIEKTVDEALAKIKEIK